MEQIRNLVGTNTQNVVENQAFSQTRTIPSFTKVNASRNAIQAEAKMNTLGKVRLVCFLLVVTALLFLIIYNFIAMAYLRTNIATIQNSIQTEQTQITDLKSQINALTNNEAILQRVVEAGFSAEIAPNATVALVEVPKSVEKDVQAQTNWFNDLCLFISSIFGG